MGRGNGSAISVIYFAPPTEHKAMISRSSFESIRVPYSDFLLCIVKLHRSLIFRNTLLKKKYQWVTTQDNIFGFSWSFVQTVNDSKSFCGNGLARIINPKYLNLLRSIFLDNKVVKRMPAEDSLLAGFPNRPLRHWFALHYSIQSLTLSNVHLLRPQHSFLLRLVAVYQQNHPIVGVQWFVIPGRLMEWSSVRLFLE